MKKVDTQFKAYNGRNIDHMPLALARGVVILSVAEFMQNRKAVMEQLGDVYADTSDLVAYGDEKRSDEIKMILTVDKKGRITENGRKVLELISPSQQLVSGAVALDSIYDKIQGINLSRKELEKFGINDYALAEVQVLNNPVWRILLRHPDAVPTEFAYDKGFIKKVVGRTFAEMNKRAEMYGRYRSVGMGIHLDVVEKFSNMRAWCVHGLWNGSDVDGKGDLDIDLGRLVGVAPKIS